MKGAAELVGRLLLAHVFVLSGLGKLHAYAPAQAYMHSVGLPGALLPLVIALELVGGAGVALGWYTRGAALALAGLATLTALVFHADFAGQGQMAAFMKDWAIAGGLLMLAAYGAGPISVDARRCR